MADSFAFPSSAFAGKLSNEPAIQHSLAFAEQLVTDKDSEYWRIRKDFVEIRKFCRETGMLFEDAAFPPQESSLISRGKPSGEKDRKASDKFINCLSSITSWQRPNALRFTGTDDDKGQTNWLLWKDAHPSDIQQGRLGNCWFVAALALISERRELLSKIFISRKVNPEGVYALRLFKDGRWQGVIIDDFLPCDGHKRLVFSQCRRKQLWVMLIEKAMSKLHGSYQSLEAGLMSDGLNYLSGFTSERITFENEHDHDLLWAKLMSFDSANFLMGASISSDNENMRNYIKTELGLIANHVYSILRVVFMENYRLVQLRNPWGNFSWKGNWSDDSPLWNETMSAYLSPHRAKEGIFWMSFEDFIQTYSSMDVCKVRKNWNIQTLEGILPPYADPDCQPSFEIVTENSVEVDISLYKSSKEHGRECMQETDIGLMIFETNELAASSSDFQLVKPVQKSITASHREVSCNLLLSPGKYFLVPFSFGHWTTDLENEKYYNFALTIHSSRDIQFAAVHRSNVLADSLISYAKHFGKKKPLLERSDDIKLTSVTLGYGDYVTVLENYSKSKYVEIDSDATLNGNFISTRNSFKTRDEIPPLHCRYYASISGLILAKYFKSFALKEEQRVMDSLINSRFQKLKLIRTIEGHMNL